MTTDDPPASQDFAYDDLDDPIDDWPCGAMLVGSCDQAGFDHWCEHPDNEHDGPHACACGHTWSEADA